MSALGIEAAAVTRGGWPASRAGLPAAVRITEIRQENDRTKVFVLDAHWNAQPGQFAMLWLPGLDEKPFSLMSDGPLSFAIAAVGPFSRALHGLSVGDLVWVRGPFGRGFRLVGTDHLLVGGGYGAAPLLLLARRALAESHRVRCCIGARTADDLLLVRALRMAGADVIATTEDGSQGERGLVTEAAGRMAEFDPPSTLYACGPHAMLGAVRSLASAKGLPAQLSWEAYMRCAIGICGSCEHEGVLLCADGPVVEYGAPAGGARGKVTRISAGYRE